MDMNSATSYTYYYDISVVALPKYVAMFNISFGIFGNALDVKIFTFLRTNFTKDLTRFLSLDPCTFKTTTLLRHGFIAEE